MAVTKQTYTATATWTASDLAGIFRSAFIDAGLMTEWHDSFLSGSVENRVLAVDYGTGTYSNTYYWFMFTADGVYQNVATGWNVGSHIPAGPTGAGTQYLDWLTTTTNTTANHAQLIVLSAATTITITRYSSAIVTGYAWFVVRNGSTYQSYHIPRAGAPVQSWINLDKTIFHCSLRSNTATTNYHGIVTFLQNPPILRRSWVAGSALVGQTATGFYMGSSSPFALNPQVASYQAVGIESGNGNNTSSTYARAFLLPTHFSSINPAFSANSVPVFTALPYCCYINEALPADFGVSFHYANNTMAVFDKLIVTAATEEWEMLSVANNGTVTTGASPMFLARVT